MDAKTLLDRMNNAHAPTGICLDEPYAEFLATIAHKLSADELDKLVTFGAALTDMILIPYMRASDWAKVE
ncbi:hypothetical protein CCO03_08570 [Comamonas serinivorans]|uniref:Uncharacterized protein n=1 Tax=Comamonas serinivorans TaxID=1082851 RepID=A0A1Y0EMR1_9BURK|nr:hypothetical protein [Comamonas serinivorans]ARU04720.1 hypothetical protein CCO03_08570 [Comamonas serinivorans]